MYKFALHIRFYNRHLFLFFLAEFTLRKIYPFARTAVFTAFSKTDSVPNHFTRIFKIFVYPLIIRIHGTFNIKHWGIVYMSLHLPHTAFVMRQSCGVIFLNPSASFLKIHAVTALIAERPNAHACSVFIAYNISLNSVQNCIFPIGILCKQSECNGLWTAEKWCCSVNFNIRFRNNIKAVFVAQLHKPRSIWIVTCTKCIDIVLFHKL